MASNSGASHDEEQQNDLMAALASARELGPDMDKAVAASYLEKQKTATQAQTQQSSPQQAVVAAPSQRRPMYFIGPPIGLIAYIAILIASQGTLWWTFWLIFCFGGLGWWGWRHEEHVQRRVDHYERRRARYGYGPSGPYDNGYGPAPTQQPTQPQVQRPQAQPPTEYD